MVATDILWFRDDNNSSLEDTIKIGAFAESCHKVNPEPLMPDVPFSCLLNSVQQSPPKSPPQPKSIQQQDKDNGNNQPAPPTDDFIMLDLKTPFAGCNVNTELGVFYRECQCAPPLQGCSDKEAMADQVGDLTRQLEAFESNFKEYESVINRICLSENNN